MAQGYESTITRTIGALMSTSLRFRDAIRQNTSIGDR
jgi:hypothetical protein